MKKPTLIYDEVTIISHCTKNMVVEEAMIVWKKFLDQVVSNLEEFWSCFLLNPIMIWCTSGGRV